MQPSEAKQSVVDFVEDSSTAAGGTWEHVSGPGVRECEQQGGATGTAFVYVIKRADTAGADADSDIRLVSKHWQDLGIKVEEYQSGGADPVPGVPGKSAFVYMAWCSRTTTAAIPRRPSSAASRPPVASLVFSATFPPVPVIGARRYGLALSSSCDPFRGQLGMLRVADRPGAGPHLA